MRRESFRVLRKAATAGLAAAVVSMMPSSVAAATSSATGSSFGQFTDPGATVSRAASNAVGSVTEYLTNGGQSNPTSQTTLPLTTASKGQIKLDPTTTYQTIQGFGATLTDSAAADLMALSPSDRSSVMNALFNPKTGAGISLIRIGLGATDFSPRAFTYDDTTDGQPDPNLANFSITQNYEGSLPDATEVIPLLQQARSINPNLTVMATPWTPPPWMKSDPIYDGAYFTSTKKGKLKQVDVSFNPTYYQPYANYFVKFIQAYEAEGVTINYVTPQNEPEYAPTTYPGMLMPEPEEADFVQNFLAKALSTAGLSTKVLGYDHNWNDAKYPTSLLNDAPSVSGIAWHCYKGSVKSQSVVASTSAYSGRSTFITECSGTGPQSSSGTTEPYFANNLDWDTTNLIVGGLSNWASGVQLYNLALDENCGPQLNGGTSCVVPPPKAPNEGCQDCRGVVTINTNPPASLADLNVEYYLLAAANEAFSPGSVRIKTTAKGGVQAVAATNPDGTTGLFVANTSNTAITSPITVEDGGYGFTIPSTATQPSIPANSVASFRWSNPNSHSHGGPTMASDGEGYCTVLLSGGVDCWGDNTDGELGNGTTGGPEGANGYDTPQAVTGITDAVSVSSNIYGYCAVLSTGGVDCWGYNFYGQLGNGTTGGPDGEYGYDTPQPVTGITDAVSVSSDGNDAIGTGYGTGYCAVLSTGSVDCWGYDTHGELGNGTTGGPDGEYGYDTPQPVTGITDAVSVSSANDGSYCAVLSTGGVDCWGYNLYGELGNGTTGGPDGANGYDTPQAVTGITDAVSVSSQGVDDNYCAVLSNGGVDCWGVNGVGELGNGTTGGPDGASGYDTPQAVTGITDAVSVSSGNYGSYCAVLLTGGVDCWGYNALGELGNGTTGGPDGQDGYDTPQAVTGITKAVSVSSDIHEDYCAVLSTGGVECWGRNTYGELGNGTTSGPDGEDGYDTAQAVTGIIDAASVSSQGVDGNYCAVLSTGGVDCWGYNALGELGNGTTGGPDGQDGYDTPQAVTGITDAS
jgi:glucosylceramidase